MKGLSRFGATAVVFAAATWTHGAVTRAADLKSGIPVGGEIGPYSTTKCGGIDDGVAVDDSLCYT